MELIISGIISVALVIIIGLITGSIWYAVVYNIMMIVIRLYTGGYHADTYVGCNVCYCGTYMISLLMLRIQMYVRGTIITWLIALAGYLIIVLNAPLEHHNKEAYDGTERKIYDCKCSAWNSVYAYIFILNIIGVVIRYGKYSFLCQISLYINTMLLIIGLLLLLGVRKEGRFHEEDS